VVNILTGGGKMEEVFLRTAVPNLYVIPAGPAPPNPAELLSSERMRDFLQQVRASFDFVVIDSPPVLAVTDATLIGHLVDGSLLCFAAGKVPREEIRACRDRLVRNEVRILGTVLNRYRSDQGRYGKRYQRYEAYAAQGPEEAAKDSAA
jgi:protein-tyrosine kinase